MDRARLQDREHHQRWQHGKCESGKEQAFVGRVEVREIATPRSSHALRRISARLVNPNSNRSCLAPKTNVSLSSVRACFRTRVNIQCIDVMNFHHVRRFWPVRKTYELGADLPQATGRGA